MWTDIPRFTNFLLHDVLHLNLFPIFRNTSLSFLICLFSLSICYSCYKSHFFLFILFHSFFFVAQMLVLLDISLAIFTFNSFLHLISFMSFLVHILLWHTGYLVTLLIIACGVCDNYQYHCLGKTGFWEIELGKLEQGMWGRLHACGGYWLTIHKYFLIQDSSSIYLHLFLSYFHYGFGNWPIHFY